MPIRNPNEQRELLAAIGDLLDDHASMVLAINGGRGAKTYMDRQERQIRKVAKLVVGRKPDPEHLLLIDDEYPA